MGQEVQDFFFFMFFRSFDLLPSRNQFGFLSAVSESFHLFFLTFSRMASWTFFSNPTKFLFKLSSIFLYTKAY